MASPSPPQAEPRARARLENLMASGSGAPAAQLALAAFAADIFAADGKPDAALAARLFAVREQLPPFSRALLLHAMALAKDDPVRLRSLARELESIVRLDGAAAHVVTRDQDAGLYDTDTRTTAMLLRALLAMEPGAPAGAQARPGAARLPARRAVRDHARRSLGAARARRPAAAHPPPAEGVKAQVFLGDALVHDTTVQGSWAYGFGIPLGSLRAASGKPLTFAARGQLHYHVRLVFARRDLPVVPVESGMSLRRTVRPLDAGVAPAGTLRAGELVAVELTLATPSPRRAVVIESPLPAGLEAADADLRLGGTWLHALEKTAPATRRELRDDRVVYFIDELPAGLVTLRFVARASTPGVFVAPPARAEEMYAPETWARTPTETVTIEPRGDSAAGPQPVKPRGN